MLAIGHKKMSEIEKIMNYAYTLESVIFHAMTFSHDEDGDACFDGGLVQPDGIRLRVSLDELQSDNVAGSIDIYGEVEYEVEDNELLSYEEVDVVLNTDPVNNFQWRLPLLKLASLLSVSESYSKNIPNILAYLDANSLYDVLPLHDIMNKTLQVVEES